MILHHVEVQYEIQLAGIKVVFEIFIHENIKMYRENIATMKLGR